MTAAFAERAERDYHSRLLGVLGPLAARVGTRDDDTLPALVAAARELRLAGESDTAAYVALVLALADVGRPAIDDALIDLDVRGNPSVLFDFYDAVIRSAAG